jgi:hypothetical protein
MNIPLYNKINKIKPKLNMISTVEDIVYIGSILYNPMSIFSTYGIITGTKILYKYKII